MQKTFKTDAELSRFLGVTKGTIGLWRKQGMPGHLNGVRYGYKWREVAAWLKKKSATHKALAISVEVEDK